MTLIEFLDKKMISCTHMMIVKNGEHPEFEAILPLTQDVIEQLHNIWTKQYYAIQEKRMRMNKEKQQAGRDLRAKSLKFKVAKGEK